MSHYTEIIKTVDIIYLKLFGLFKFKSDPYVEIDLSWNSYWY